jgi:hypothetical protein
MMYAVDMGPGGMINVLSFMKSGSGIQKLMEAVELYRHTPTES